MVSGVFAAGVGDIAPDIERSDGRASYGQLDKTLVQVVSPNAHVAVGAFTFNAIVPAMGNKIPINIRITIGKTLRTKIRAISQGVIEIMLIVGINLIITNDMVAFAVNKGAGLWTS